MELNTPGMLPKRVRELLEWYRLLRNLRRGGQVGHLMHRKVGFSEERQLSRAATESANASVSRLVQA